MIPSSNVVANKRLVLYAGFSVFFVVEWGPRSSRKGKLKVFLRVGFSISLKTELTVLRVHWC